MVDKLDLKDRKILYYLSSNSRLSLSQIGDKIGLSKNVVRYRIERLQEKGIIKNFYTVIDVYKLEYTVIKCHYTYQFTNPEIEKNIIEYFVENPYTVLVASARGTYDLAVILTVKDIKEFHQIFLETQEKFGYYFKDKTLAFFINEQHYQPSFLLPEADGEMDREVVMFTGGGGKEDIDKQDYDILKFLSNNARLPLTETADKLSKSVSFVKYRLKKLMKKGIIRGFRVDFDIKKLGFQVFRVHLYLSQYTSRNKIIQYVKQNPHLVFVDTYAGDADLDLQFYLENIDYFYKLMQNISEKFPDTIRFYNYYSIIKYHKFLYFPDR